jgi:SlyX protein
MSESNSRLDDLESRIAFQEEAIDQLSEITIRQAKELDELRRMIMILNDRVKNTDNNGFSPAADVPPPHY